MTDKITVNEAELKPCPFCGSKALIWRDHETGVLRPHIWCANSPRCGAELSLNTGGEDETAEAIAAWNTRHESTKELIEGLEEAESLASSIRELAQSAWHTAAGCASTHGDPGGGLEMTAQEASEIGSLAGQLEAGITAILSRHKGDK